MSWHFSRALVEASSGAICSGGDVCAPSKSTPTPEAYYWPDKTTGHSRLSRFGMTSEPLTEPHGEAVLMSCLAAFPAKTSAKRVEGQESKANNPACGEKWHGLLAKYDRDSRSWRTAQCSLLGGLDEFSETWPKWGSMRSGECWERPTQERPTGGNESGLWATPCAMDANPRMGGELFVTSSGTVRAKNEDGSSSNRGLATQVLMIPPSGNWPTPTTADAFTDKLKSSQQKDGSMHSVNLSQAVRMWPTPQASDTRDRGNLSTPAIKRRVAKGKQINLSMSVSTESGRLNPGWVEWLMGWPIGWTDLKPLATARFREWLQQHGGRSTGASDD